KETAPEQKDEDAGDDAKTASDEEKNDAGESELISEEQLKKESQAAKDSVTQPSPTTEPEKQPVEEITAIPADKDIADDIKSPATKEAPVENDTVADEKTDEKPDEKTTATPTVQTAPASQPKPQIKPAPEEKAVAKPEPKPTESVSAEKAKPIEEIVDKKAVHEEKVQEVEIDYDAGKKFLVRSVALTAGDDVVRLLNTLIRYDFHPVVLEETLSTGDVYYYLDMGRFDSVKNAVRLLVYLRNFSDEFFMLGVGGTEKGPAGGLVISRKFDELFPHHAGGGGEDLIALLSSDDFAGDASEDSYFPSTIGVAAVDRTPSTIAPAQTDQDGVTIEKQLRHVAWEMRENGYDVYLEDETFAKPEGVLVGIFETREDALDLSEELKSYGYSVNMIFESGFGEKYYVYADPESVEREITIIHPDAIKD
ncbi:MAG: hypothetical protein KAG97_09095, partial [Victivallales bacterium]|nr:hypothetical protein [Victivallales bacterium]